MAFQSKLKHPLLDDLFQAILLLKNEEECYRFFEDICTVGEIKAIAQRLAVARMLDKGETYVTIASRTRASTATVSRVNRALHYGADGYKLILERMQGCGPG